MYVKENSPDMECDAKRNFFLEKQVISAREPMAFSEYSIIPGLFLKRGWLGILDNVMRKPWEKQNL